MAPRGARGRGCADDAAPASRKSLRCLIALWIQEPVDFAGEFYTVPRSFLSPAPLQRPHPPLLVGGTAEPALRRAGRLGQGWIASSQLDPSTLSRCVEVVRDGAVEAGRDPRALRILVRVVPELLDDDPGPARAPFQGTPGQLRADLELLAARGATEVILDLNLSPRVGTPDVEQRQALIHAERLLEELAPGG